MQLKPNEMIDQEHDSLQDNEEEEEEDDLADDLTISSEKGSIAEDTSTWSFIPPALQEEERSILPVDSSDSIPSRYALSKDNNEDLIFRPESPVSFSRNTEGVDEKEIEIKEPETSTTTANTSVQTEPVPDPNLKIGQEKSISENMESMEIIVEQLKRSRMLCLWIISIVITMYFIRLSSKKSQEIYQLQQEIDLLRKTISEMEHAKMKQNTGWILKGSKIVKEWASAVVDLNTTDFFNSHINESTYLDNWPGEAINTMKNISSSMTTVFSEVFEDVSTSTKDAFFSASESFASVSDSFTSVDTVTETINSVSETMLDIWNAQKYALVFGALYFKIYENYYQDDGF